MSLEKIHLRKLLQIFYLPENRRRSVLREDVKSQIKKENGGSTNGGGDFYTPFWTDAKRHVAGDLDLHAATEARVESNFRRRRLYPLLRDGFLGWWDERRRWRNEPFIFMPQSVKTHIVIPEVRGVVKVENLLALKVGDQFDRLVYPYFSEEPELPDEGGRIGLWLLGQALTDYQNDDLRILDVLRSTSFSTTDNPFRGNERDIFLRKYEEALVEWNRIRDEYK